MGGDMREGREERRGMREKNNWEKAKRKGGERGKGEIRRRGRREERDVELEFATFVLSRPLNAISTYLLLLLSNLSCFSARSNIMYQNRSRRVTHALTRISHCPERGAAKIA